jgi:carbonic anhydrase
MKKLTIVALVLMAVMALGMIGVAGAVAADEVHWGYSGETGPAHWGELSPDFATCAKGTEQSPVDIPAGAPVNPASIVFNYQPSALTIANNGHTIRVDYAPGSAITVEGTTYQLLQYHFHAPSEHTLAGKASPLELHLVHQSADGRLAVVGVLINSGAENPAYASVLAHLPAAAGAPLAVAGVTTDAAALLPADRAYYRYNGSLTTPACTEGVKWFVLRAPVELSAAQIAAFTALYPNDARPVQPLNSRSFLLSALLPGGTNLPPGMPRTGGDILVFPPAALVALALLFLGTGLALARRKA